MLRLDPGEVMLAAAHNRDLTFCPEQVARVATERQVPRAQVAATDGATAAGDRGLGA